jgi:hypothetical protein
MQGDVYLVLDILSLFITVLVSIYLALLVSVLLLMLFFHLKRMILQMDEGKWIAYFNTIKAKGLFLRMLFCFFIALLLIAAFNTYVFWQGNLMYGGLLIACGIFHISFKLYTKKAEYIDKMKNQFPK